MAKYLKRNAFQLTVTGGAGAYPSKFMGVVDQKGLNAVF